MIEKEDEDILVESLKITLKEAIVRLPAFAITHENLMEYANKIREDDANNEIVLAIENAIIQTKKRYKNN